MSGVLAKFNNLTSCIRNSLKRCLCRSHISGSIFIQCALSILRRITVSNDSSKAHSKCGFYEYYSQLLDVVNEHGFPSSEVTSTLNELRALFPPVQIQVTDESIWGCISISVQTHLKSTFEGAVANIELTGRTLSPEDKKYLRLLLTHSCGWSATYPEQMNAHWATYFKITYPDIKDLVIILDRLIYPEELGDLPDVMFPDRVGVFLLATPESYYVYNCSMNQWGVEFYLCLAGQTLEEVYLGMKAWKYKDVEDPWDVVTGLEYDTHFLDYFPFY